jgi:hypothetical protein
MITCRRGVTSVLPRSRFLLTSKLRYRNIVCKTFVEAQSIDVQGFVGPPISRESSRRQTECQRRKKPRRKRSSLSGREARFSAERDLSPASTTRQNQAALTSGLFCWGRPSLTAGSGLFPACGHKQRDRDHSSSSRGCMPAVQEESAARHEADSRSRRNPTYRWHLHRDS